MGASRQRPHVLVVDDDAAIRFLAEEALDQAGYRVTQASNGRDAIDSLDAAPADIVLLDIKMPVTDGFDALGAIRQLAGGSDTPVVMMTGLDDLESINRAYELGATDFVTKPINYHILTHRLRYILRSKETADALRRRDDQLRKAQRIARFGHYRWDVGSRSLWLSDAAARILGVAAEGDSWSLDDLLERVHTDDRQLVRGTLEHCLDAPRAYEFEHRLPGKRGSEPVVRHEAEIDMDERGEVRSMIGFIQDVTARRRAQERVHYLAYFDSVTDLPNRTLVKELLRNALVNARRRERCTAVLFCDLNNFKQVNDTMGHDTGDRLLKAVAARLRGCLRCGTSIRPGVFDERPGLAPDRVLDVVSRIGGDEFLAVLTEVRRPEDAAKVVQRIRKAFTRSFAIGGQQITITMSIGISIFPQDGTNIETLLKNADAAMYRAKQNGRDSYQFYTDAINADAVRRFSLETALRRALERNELLLYYQPKVDLQNGKVVGVEALVRWENPERGIVSPGEFIPLAEETGLIVPMGEWILRTACEQNREWQQRLGSGLSMAVNLSARQFREPEFLECIRRVLAETKLAPELLELELTESLLMEDTERCVTLMHAIREEGATLAIDDFGTGYSSLGYLKRFPINTLKIDRTFIRDLQRDERDAAIVAATILLAHQLGLQVVAEGVEERAQRDFLRSQGCDAAQGYLFARPMSADDCENWLARERQQGEADCVVSQP